MQCCVIGIRYSVVRRQFRNISGQKEETKLLDYQTQQQKLFPLIAAAYVQSAGTDYVTQLYEQLNRDVSNSDFKLMEVMHHLTSGMKSVYT
jgi:hypothetical protein